MAVEAKRGCGDKSCRTCTTYHASAGMSDYLAGPIDGDGCILIVRRDRKKTSGDRARGLSFSVIVKIGGETAHLRYLKSLWHVGYIYIRKRKNQRHLAEWTIAGENARFVLRRTRPRLILKRPQADNALQFPNCHSRWEATPSFRQRQIKRWRLMKYLNSRVGRGNRRYHGSRA